MTMDLYDRVLGCLSTAAMGDALGAATEQWSTAEIYARYRGPIRTFHKPPLDTFAAMARNEAGEVTDDASQMFYLAQMIIETGGRVTEDAWITCLLRWAAESPKVANMGPSTRAVIEAVRAGRDPYKVNTVGQSDRQTTHMGVTNGAAMRIAPVGLVHPGNPSDACRDAVVTCLPAHNTQRAVSATCALAAGVAHALTDNADVFSVVRACLEGASLGEELARHDSRIRLVPGPRIERRIELAVTLALKARSREEAMGTLESYVGNSVEIAESVPTAIGLFVFAHGDPMESIVAGANVGNDTDTIATMAGALAGALRGFSRVPQDLYAVFRAANQVDLEGIARGLTEIAVRRIPVNVEDRT
jgi:ADP-ribosylglycohydrolase